MSKFIGFSTQNLDQVRQYQPTSGVDGGAGSVVNSIRPIKKFRLLDQDLVIRDFINALNIPQGQLPGRPEYGTSLWSFVFDPNTFDVQAQLEAEVRRVAALDPRLILNTVTCFPQDNGILLEVELAVSLINEPIQLQIIFDQTTSRAFGA